MRGRTTRFRSTTQYSLRQVLAVAVGVPLVVATAVVALSYPAAVAGAVVGAVAALAGRRLLAARDSRTAEEAVPTGTTEDGSTPPLQSADRRSP